MKVLYAVFSVTLESLQPRSLIRILQRKPELGLMRVSARIVGLGIEPTRGSVKFRVYNFKARKFKGLVPLAARLVAGFELKGFYAHRLKLHVQLRGI